MIFRNYNDYEIIHLVKRGNEEAFQFMVTKYKYFIAKKINSFNLSGDFDDIYQESLMVLYKSVIKFDDTYNKTFTRYFELNLTNKLISIKNKHNRYGKFISEKLPSLYVNETKDIYSSYLSEIEVKYALSTLSNLEKKVFQAKIIQKRTVRETAVFLNCDEKKIYNTLDRIKNKLKMQLL